MVYRIYMFKEVSNHLKQFSILTQKLPELIIYALIFYKHLLWYVYEYEKAYKIKTIREN